MSFSVSFTCWSTFDQKLDQRVYDIWFHPLASSQSAASSQPAASQPAASQQPASHQPAASQPAQPASQQPASQPASQPEVSQPSASQPSASHQEWQSLDMAQSLENAGFRNCSPMVLQPWVCNSYFLNTILVWLKPPLWSCCAC